MLRKVLVGAQLTLAASAAIASPLFISYDDFNYTGTVTRYGSLADAQAGVNAISTAAISTATNADRSTLPNARDAQVYVASGAPGYDPNPLSYFSTAWYFTTVPANTDGWGNPNNTNTGFVQYYDTTAAPAVSGGWSNANTRFSVSIDGGAGDSSNAGRLWAAPYAGGAASYTAGAFREFELNLVADFGSAATLNGTTGWYETAAAPTAVTGGAKGIFENDSTTNPSLNGFYAFDFAFAPGSWAASVGATWDNGGSTQYAPQGSFAAPGQVPEPGSLALLGIAMLSLTAARARRR